MAESNSVDVSPSSPIECFLEKIPPVIPSINDPYKNEGSGKRVKYEREEYEQQSTAYSAKPVFHDDCEAFGHSVAAQLRQMSKIQKILAQRLISEICFRGQLDAIRGNTCLTSQTFTVPQHQPTQFFNARPYYSGGADYAPALNNANNYHNHIPAIRTPATPVYYHSSNLVNNLQQSGQTPNSIATTVNTAENVI